jgi:hypothetical protein
LVVRPHVAIATTRLPAARAGAAYHGRLAVRGGVGPFRWSATGLPGSLKLGARTGFLTGTPGSAGAIRLTVRVRDALGGVATKRLSLTIR